MKLQNLRLFALSIAAGLTLATGCTEDPAPRKTNKPEGSSSNSDDNPTDTSPAAANSNHKITVTVTQIDPMAWWKNCIDIDAGGGTAQRIGCTAQGVGSTDPLAQQGQAYGVNGTGPVVVTVSTYRSSGCVAGATPPCANATYSSSPDHARTSRDNAYAFKCEKLGANHYKISYEDQPDDKIKGGCTPNGSNGTKCGNDWDDVVFEVKATDPATNFVIAGLESQGCQ